MIQTIKNILALPRELAHLVDAINCGADEVQENLRTNGVCLDRVKIQKNRVSRPVHPNSSEE